MSMMTTDCCSEGELDFIGVQPSPIQGGVKWAPDGVHDMCEPRELGSWAALQELSAELRKVYDMNITLF